MKKNENGFGLVVVVLMLVLAGIVGFTGWYVWQNQQKNSANSNTAETASNNKETSDTKTKIDTTITDVNISLKTEADISKLPSITPTSFKEYILEKLKKNTPDADGCIELYSISKISIVNIKGGGASVSTSANDGGSCIGGAPRVWVLAPTGTWDDVTLNGPACKSDNGGLVYEEFAPECYTDPNVDSLVKNPNGSIASLAQ
jgi:hypothetical protein